MLAPAKLQALQQLISQYSKEELLWISGYMAGIATDEAAATAKPAAPASAQQTITIIYGTETGNSKKAATMATAALKQQGIKTRLVAAEQYKPEQLLKETHIVLVISTQGEGEPPANAKALYDYLHRSTENLSHLRYSVLALGSRSYPLFCQAGLDVDAQLKRLNAHAFVPIALCDDDYEPVATAWTVSLLDALVTSAAPAPQVKTVAAATDSKKQFRGTIGVNQLLNDRGSKKEVHHIEIDLPEEVFYQPGNAIGIVPANPAETVSSIMALLRMQPNDKLLYKNEKQPVRSLLEEKLSVQYLPLTVIRKYAALVQADIPETRMDLYDLLRIYPPPAEIDAQQVIGLLNPITPRLYTISSSPNAYPGQLHLTVERHRFHTSEGTQYGFGSDYLTSLRPGQSIAFFLHQQKHFQIPRSDRHLIMIAQGTGIAPFRSMMAERDATGASGKNWLLFGEEDFLTDFYYQTEIQGWFETGSLRHVSLAFEKNRNHPLKVQDLIAREADRIWQWLETGAYLFVSGEKDPMGKAVEQALLTVIAEKQHTELSNAAQYLKQLAKEGRYAKELY